MDVCIQYMTDRPATLDRKLKVDLGVERSIDDERFRTGSDQIRKSALAGASKLNQRRRGGTDFCFIPGQAPGLHPSGEGKRVDATSPQLRGGEFAGSAGGADRHHRLIRRKSQAGQRRRVSRTQGRVGISMDTPRNAPLIPFRLRADIQDCYRLLSFQHST